MTALTFGRIEVFHSTSKRCVYVILLLPAKIVFQCRHNDSKALVGLRIRRVPPEVFYGRQVVSAIFLSVRIGLGYQNCDSGKALLRRSQLIHNVVA